MINETLIQDDDDYEGEGDAVLVTVDDDIDGEGSVAITLRQGIDVVVLTGGKAKRLIEIIFPHAS